MLKLCSQQQGVNTEQERASGVYKCTDFSRDFIPSMSYNSSRERVVCGDY